MHIHLPNELAPVAAVVVLTALGIYWPWHFWRSRQLLEHWAARNGFQIIHSEFRWFFKGPFFLLSRGKTVYRVTVRDHNGRDRSGWVRCGGIWFGLLTDSATVVWDRESDTIST
jgi:hypothetical protein